MASSACSSNNLTQFPTSDVACAVASLTSLPSNTSDILKTCCKSAAVQPFNGACGYYCLSLGQSVADLQKCFQNNGANPSAIFCNANSTATATATPSGRAASTASSSSSSSSPSSSKSNAAAAGAMVPRGVSKAGLGMLGMLVVSVFASACL